MNNTKELRLGHINFMFCFKSGTAGERDPGGQLYL